MKCHNICQPDTKSKNYLTNDCYDPGIIGKYVYYCRENEGDSLYIDKGMDTKFRARFEFLEFRFTESESQRLESVAKDTRLNRYMLKLKNHDDMYLKKDRNNNLIMGYGTIDALEVHFPGPNGSLFDMGDWTAVKETVDFLPGFDFVNYDQERIVNK